MPKPSFSHAPDFELPCAFGSFRLNDLEGRHRVALWFARDDHTAREAINQVEQNAPDWNERDLILVLIVADSELLASLKDAPPGVFIALDAQREVGKLFGVSSDENAFFLLGKSRFPVALAVDYLPDEAEIFELIDAMPMRQNEMRERAK